MSALTVADDIMAAASTSLSKVLNFFAFMWPVHRVSCRSISVYVCHAGKLSNVMQYASLLLLCLCYCQLLSNIY